MSAPKNEPTELTGMHAVTNMSVWFLLMNIHYLTASGSASLAGLRSSWLIGRAPLLLASPYRPILHESPGGFSPPQQHMRTGDSVTNNPETIRQQRGKYFRVFFTFVQGQTPVTPPTLANTKENWMEEGTDHVISLGNKYKMSHHKQLTVHVDMPWIKFVFCLFCQRRLLHIAKQAALRFEVNLEWISHPRGDGNGSVRACYLGAWNSATLIQSRNEPLCTPCAWRVDLMTDLIFIIWCILQAQVSLTLYIRMCVYISGKLNRFSEKRLHWVSLIMKFITKLFCFVLLWKNTQPPREQNSLLQVGFTTVAQGHFQGQVLSEEAYQFVQETTFSWCWYFKTIWWMWFWGPAAGEGPQKFQWELFIKLVKVHYVVSG